MSKEKAENELRRLISKGQKLFVDELDTCIDWIDNEISQANKILDQIERAQRLAPDVDVKLFNDSRECCDLIRKWIVCLKEHRTSVLNQDEQLVLETLDQLGSANQGFSRSRKILFNK